MRRKPTWLNYWREIEKDLYNMVFWMHKLLWNTLLKWRYLLELNNTTNRGTFNCVIRGSKLLANDLRKFDKHLPYQILWGIFNGNANEIKPPLKGYSQTRVRNTCHTISLLIRELLIKLYCMVVRNIPIDLIMILQVLTPLEWPI